MAVRFAATLIPAFEQLPAPVAPDLAALRPEWHHRASCRGMTELFFVELGHGRYDRARELCASCPVRLECDAEADEMAPLLSLHGLRAGVTGAERRRRRNG